MYTFRFVQTYIEKWNQEHILLHHRYANLINLTYCGEVTKWVVPAICSMGPIRMCSEYVII